MNFNNFFKERKYLILFGIFALLVFSIVLIIYFEATKYEYVEDKILVQVGFFEDYLTKFTKVGEKAVSEMVGALLFLYNQMPELRELVTPIELLAIGIVETNFENIKGDHGNSLGYFQIQAPTYWYLKYQYLEIYEGIDFLSPWYWDDIKERADVQIITAALYLYDLKIRYGEDEAYSLYNGGSEPYEEKIIYTMSWLNVKYDQYLSKMIPKRDIVLEKAF